MKIVVAPDSFKESMTAPEAAAAMVAGVRSVLPEAECVQIPMSDGGEGFAEAVGTALQADRIEVAVHDARGRRTAATLRRAGDLAILDVASAVGLGLVPAPERDVMESDSRGVADLVRAALDTGATRLVVGLGGSATNDGGAGLLTGLGARFVDSDGRPVAPTPSGLRRAVHLDLTGLDPRLAHVRLEAACDVTNPLLGPAGASAVFGPQKGASPREVAALEAILRHLTELAPPAAADAADLPGAGAAGGLGWALLGFLGATMRPGVQLVADLTGLSQAVAGADLVLTGEGSADAQTLSGKTASGVAAVAGRAGVPCVLLAGRVTPAADALLERGVTALVPIVPGVVDLAGALRAGPANLERASATVVRLFLAGAASAR